MKRCPFVPEVMPCHPLGYGSAAASDVMSLDSNKHLYTARVGPQTPFFTDGYLPDRARSWGIPYDAPCRFATPAGGRD